MSRLSMTDGRYRCTCRAELARPGRSESVPTSPVLVLTRELVKLPDDGRHGITRYGLPSRSRRSLPATYKGLRGRSETILPVFFALPRIPVGMRAKPPHEVSIPAHIAVYCPSCGRGWEIVCQDVDPAQRSGIFFGQ